MRKTKMNNLRLKVLFRDYLIIHKLFFEAKRLLDKEIVKEYGFHYSDKDLDEIIDALDYDQGAITFEKFDKIMKKAKKLPSTN